jgi:polynucleotide 5'-kinase involved in rRNA processing
MIGLGQSNQDGFLEDSEQQFAHRLAALRPYVVPMENVECTVSQQQVAMDFACVGDQKLVWKAMNGSIVGLCRREENTSADLDDRAISLPPCIGLGIVRAIDRANELAYVLTRVSPKDLQSVDILCLGSISLPLEASFRGVNAESFSNVTFEKDGKQHEPVLGAEPMKSRNSIGRKSQSN